MPEPQSCLGVEESGVIMSESNLVSFESLQKKQKERQIYSRWTEFYNLQRHEDLLEALVYEHEHDFPLRKSENILDQMRHKALLEVLNDRAQTDFLRSLLKEIQTGQNN